MESLNVVEMVKELVKGCKEVEIVDRKDLIKDFVDSIEDKEEVLVEVLSMMCSCVDRGEGKKGEIKGILRSGAYSINEIGEMMGINNKNVSSLLSYCRKDGWLLGKNSSGKIVVEKEGV